MAKVADVIKASLQKILVQASEQPIQAAEAQDFIVSMNNFMLDLDAQGVSLGYTVVTGLGDEVTIPTGALRGLINNMAVEVVDEYDGQVTGTLIDLANDGMKAMRRLGQRIPTSRYPSTLPIGSGNEWNSHNTSHFYPDQEAQILAETTGCIGLESNTNTVAGS